MFIHKKKDLDEYMSKKKIVHGFHKNFYNWSVSRLGTPVDKNYDDVNKVPIP
jgi:hypothetical protein